MPREAENVCALNGWQLDSLALSVEECIEALRDAGAEPDEYELSYYTWSDGIAFVFDLTSRSFEQLPAARHILRLRAVSGRIGRL